MHPLLCIFAQFKEVCQWSLVIIINGAAYSCCSSSSLIATHSFRYCGHTSRQTTYYSLRIVFFAELLNGLEPDFSQSVSLLGSRMFQVSDSIFGFPLWDLFMRHALLVPSS